MSVNQYDTGPQTNTDGSVSRARGGTEGQGIVSQIHPRHYEAGRRGKIFSVNTVVAGVAIPISTTTAPIVTLWNPTGSGVNAVLLRYSMGYVSGTTVAGAVGLMQVTAGSQVATGGIFTAYTSATPISGLVGATPSNACRATASAASTLTAAMTSWFYTMFDEHAAVAATAIKGVAQIHDFDGLVTVPPGVCIQVAASAASGALLSQYLAWEEVTLVGGV